MRQHTALPLPLSSFIGREREIAELRRLFALTRLLTLAGPGGCGKTRLALEVARAVQNEYADGVCLVELAPLGGPELVLQALAGALGISERAGQPMLETLVEQLRPRTLLIVLDNCEHLVLACARLAEALLSVCPGLRILATSREPLDIPGEVSWFVPSLSSPDPDHPPVDAAGCLQYESVRLFVERARSVLPSFTLRDEDAVALALICGRLDGIPLAIELAAARARALPVQQIAARLQDGLRFLSPGSRTAPPRQQSLRAVLDWSYALLSPGEQELLSRLSVFPGGFTLDAVETVCLADCPEGGSEAIDLLSSLVNKSLIIAPDAGSARPPAKPPARYRLLEVVRQYAGAGLLDLPEDERLQLHDTCLRFYLKLSVDAEQGLRGAAEVEWLPRLRAELANIRASMQWGLEHSRGDLVMEMAANLWRFWFTRGLLGEGRRWLGAALAAPGSAEAAQEVRAWATSTAGLMATYQADFQEAARLAAAGASLCSANEEGREALMSLLLMGLVARGAGDFPLARRRWEELVALARSASQPWYAATALLLLGTTASMAGDPAATEAFLLQSLAGYRALGDRQGLADASGFLGLVGQLSRDYEKARAAYGEALAMFRELDSARGAAEMLFGLGTSTLFAGDYAAAIPVLRACPALFAEIGEPAYLALSLLVAGCLAVAVGQAMGAERAARLFGAAEALHEAIKVPLPSAYRALCEPYVALSRRYLEPAGLAAAWAAGREMTLVQAVACAAEEPDYVPGTGARASAGAAAGSMVVDAPAARPAVSAAEPGSALADEPGKPSRVRLTALQTAKAQFAGLTAREREVAALVVEGKSNHEIAECLMITNRTAATHVGNILAKLEFSSRAQIAAWAVARRLAK